MMKKETGGRRQKSEIRSQKPVDKELSKFLAGKSEVTVDLFWHFIEAFRSIGDVTIHPAKTMIGIATTKRIAYVTRLGKNFVDVTFMFDQPYNENLCFIKIAQVPGTSQYNHHLRLMSKSDVNKEVLAFMKKAIAKAQKA